MESCEIIARLLEAIEQAQKSGDWIVDGACDPYSDIVMAKAYLKKHGYVSNSIDDSFVLAF